MDIAGTSASAENRPPKWIALWADNQNRKAPCLGPLIGSRCRCDFSVLNVNMRSIPWVTHLRSTYGKGIERLLSSIICRNDHRFQRLLFAPNSNFNARSFETTAFKRLLSSIYFNGSRKARTLVVSTGTNVKIFSHLGSCVPIIGVVDGSIQALLRMPSSLCLAIFL